MQNRILATDLDRTLLPNGNQEYDGSMKIFNRIRKKFILIYVTGRHLDLVKQAIDRYRTPFPDYLIAEVGTKIYKDTDFVPDVTWDELISKKTQNWDTSIFKEYLSPDKRIRLQEEDKLNNFKLSYYIDNPKDSVQIIKSVTKTVKSICDDAVIVFSIDETHNIGLLDILPKEATKLTALEHIRKRLDIDKEHVVYCGDSGNDILPLTFGYKSVLVRNAIPAIRKTVRQISIQKNVINNLHIIKDDYGHLNGNYVSGIIQGLIKFGIISEEYANHPY